MKIDMNRITEWAAARDQGGRALRLAGMSVRLSQWAPGIGAVDE